jgi:hypothetical protein
MIAVVLNPRTFYAVPCLGILIFGTLIYFAYRERSNSLWSMHRVHRVTVWASLFVFIAQELRIPIGTTRPWLAFAGWVQHFARLH